MPMSKSGVRNTLENIVVVAIVLVLFQTFLEDLATLLDWSIGARRTLLVLGFFFDLFFTIEFTIRSYDAFRHRRFKEYFKYERGWIDFLASVPLLLVNSGPTMLALLAGDVTIIGIGGMLNVLKVVKAIRIARILRLLRVLKIFRKIKHTDSVMAQRHVASITATGVSTIVFVLLGLAIVGTFLPVSTLDGYLRDHAQRVLQYIDVSGMSDSGSAGELATYADEEQWLLMVREGGDTRYSRYSDAYYDQHFGSGDYGYLSQGALEVFFDLRPLNQDAARVNLTYFVIIVAMVLAYAFLYSPRFALTVSDPIHVMRRGMDENSYNLQVRIPPENRTEEVYTLARMYNTVFLPMKARSADEGDSSQLKLEDVQDLFS